MNALVSFDRVFEVLDLVPMIRDAEDAVPVSGPASVRFDHVSFRYPSAADVSLASLESIASLEQRPNSEVLHDLTLRRRRRARRSPWSAASGGGKTTMTHLIARLYDATSGTVSVGGHDVRSVTLESLRDRVGYVTQDAHMFHDTIRGEPALRPARRRRRAAVGGAGGGADRGSRPRPARRAGHRGRASAATGCPAASGSGWPSPGCCSRRRRSSSSTRRPPTWTPSPRRPCSARWTWPWRAGPAS